MKRTLQSIALCLLLFTLIAVLGIAGNMFGYVLGGALGLVLVIIKNYWAHILVAWIVGTLVIDIAIAFMSDLKRHN